MILVFPVYPLSICVSKSTHSAALPGPAYPYVDYHRSFEIHPVSLLPGPWKVQTTGVFGDSQGIMLSGHDTGMMIPHISPIMDNLMLPITLVSTSCAWPFVSLKKVAPHDGTDKGLVGFLPIIAPFLYCDEPEGDAKKDDGDGDQGKAPDSGDGASVKKVNSQKLQETKASQGRFQRVKKYMASESLVPIPSARYPKSKAIVEGALEQRRRDLAPIKKWCADVGIPEVNGRGVVCIPTASTIQLRFGFAELAMGWAKVLVSKAFDRVAGLAFARFKSTARDSLKRLDPDVALTVASKWDPVKKLGAALGKEAIWKLGFDGMIKSLIFDMKLKAPYGLFSYGFADGKGTFFWSYTFECATPIDMRGVRGWATATMSGFYQPAIEDITKDNPNYAAGPDDGDSRTSSSQSSTGSENNPARPSKEAPKDYWTDPSQPSEPVEPEYWADPSQPSEPAEPEYLTDLSQPSEPAEPDYWSDPSKVDEPGGH